MSSGQPDREDRTSRNWSHSWPLTNTHRLARIQVTMIVWNTHSPSILIIVYWIDYYIKSSHVFSFIKCKVFNGFDQWKAMTGCLGSRPVLCRTHQSTVATPNLSRFHSVQRMHPLNNIWTEVTNMKVNNDCLYQKYQYSHQHWAAYPISSQSN